MLITIRNCINTTKLCTLNTRKIGVRCSSFRNVKKAVTSYFRSDVSEPPYKHICQVGDPVLRTKAIPVNSNMLQSSEFGKLLERLSYVMRRYGMFGLAAPQIGIPWQVFVIEMTERSLNSQDPDVRKHFKMEVVPLTYFVNPTMKIRNPAETEMFEMCGSIQGYGAEVSRAEAIEVKALNPLGELFTHTSEGMMARIIQHEYDHLQGILFVDKMDSSTFRCPFWEQINIHNGRVELKYSH